MSKHFEASSGSSSPLRKGLPPPKKPAPEMTLSESPEIRAAQERLAQIAVRIITEKVRKTDEQ
jgi:hypothetical protein